MGSTSFVCIFAAAGVTVSPLPVLLYTSSHAEETFPLVWSHTCVQEIAGLQVPPSSPGIALNNSHTQETGTRPGQSQRFRESIPQCSGGVTGLDVSAIVPCRRPLFRGRNDSRKSRAIYKGKAYVPDCWSSLFSILGEHSSEKYWCGRLFCVKYLILSYEPVQTVLDHLL